ncbi:MAG TPA: hypothetical protein VGM63_20765, partial [Mucilaginibacter sp.]
MRVVFNYYKVLLSVNIPFSFVFGYLFGATAFAFTFCTFGLLISAFFFELYYKPRYYFYFNRGFSKFKLISYSFAANLLLTVLFVIILKIF